MENLKELSKEEMQTTQGGVAGIIIVAAALIGIGVGIWLGLKEKEE
jgi:lactobin A/cerein 7B family class IIb bacteriocin